MVTRVPPALALAGIVHNAFDDKDATLTLTFKSGSGDATVTRKP